METPRTHIDERTGMIQMHPNDWMKLQRYQKALEKTVSRLVGSDPEDEGWDEALANAVAVHAGWREYEPAEASDGLAPKADDEAV